MSYNGYAEIGVNIDTESVPDPEQLMACIQSGLDDVLDTVD